MCETTSTLIDNIYTNALDKNHTSGILIRPISDHQMCFSMINLTCNKSKNATKFIEVYRGMQSGIQMEINQRLCYNICEIVGRSEIGL